MIRGQQIVVLDRIEPGEPKPDYCVHGRATCVTCTEWVWLGHTTEKLVSSRECAPMCKQCAAKYARPEHRIGHVDDHKRADGPHE